LYILRIDVAAFSLGPSGFDPTIEEVASWEEGNEEEIGFVWIRGVEFRMGVPS